MKILALLRYMKARKDVRSREGKITSSSNFERELKKLELLKVLVFVEKDRIN